MGVAHTLSRTFFWTQNILWKEDLSQNDSTVFLCGKDCVVNASKVSRYLEAVEDKLIDNDTGPKTRSGTEKFGSPQVEQNHVNVVWCADLDHGQVFELASWRERLKTEILRKAEVMT